MIGRSSLQIAIIILVLAGLAAPGRLSAQRRVTVSPGLALGTAFDRSGTTGSGWVSGGHALLTFDIETARTPVRLRGEVMAVARAQNHGPLSVGASAILPVGRGSLRPYAVAGGAFYGVGGVRHPLGWNAGAGAEYRRRATTLFVEARRYSETPSALSLGLRF